MLFFRDRPVGESFWQRFRTAAEGFTATHEEGGYWTFHVVTSPARVVALFLRLIADLPATVRVAIDDRRTHRSWSGAGIATTRIHEAFAALEPSLVAHGGVELTVFTEDDQLTLNPMRELFIYSHSERWGRLLEGKGLAEERLVRTRSWKFIGREHDAAPALSEAVERAAGALGLERV